MSSPLPNVGLSPNSLSVCLAMGGCQDPQETLKDQPFLEYREVCTGEGQPLME